MKPFTGMDDKALQASIKRLKHDAHDFGVRATHVAAELKTAGRDVQSDSLHQRYASIRDFLLRQLKDAEQEALRRAESPVRPRLSIGAAILEMCLPWARVGQRSR